MRLHIYKIRNALIGQRILFFNLYEKKTLYYIIFFHNGLVKRLNYPLVLFFTSKYTVFTRILKEECNEITVHKTVDGSDSKI